jgi:hypothetical protein
MSDYLAKPARLSAMGDAVKYWLRREPEKTSNPSAAERSTCLSRLLGRADDLRTRADRLQPLTAAPPQAVAFLSDLSNIARSRRT